MNRKNLLLSHLVAIALCVGAAVLTHLLEPTSAAPLFDLFYAAVILSAWYGGVSPGVLAAVLSFFLLNYFFIPPIQTISFVKTDHIRLFVFLIVAILTGSLTGRFRRAKSLLESKLSELNKAKEEKAEAELAIMEISDREQRRLGQNIHDGLSQSIAGVKLMVERVRKRLAARGVPEAGDIEKIEERLAESLAHADTISRGLYPVELDANGLSAALEELAARMATVHPVDCRFHAPEGILLEDNAVANHVYRIAQEAVANAIKSGRATRINIRLSARPGRVRLSVADNGVGLGNGPMRKGMGLKLMDYRARVIKGTLALRSRRRGGTVMICEFPRKG